ncbi:hypothetical protein O181_060939 [Austropuccinia psidii MF-1]|uniref:Uncharacterized protein n=1 Tax=Austropuccinia psidii MF-1 TaxID=1389203 RepID=A0A9Q3EHB7_9BASI|nr:hypothetical protein [Austropuccinia psidii MF-1]
MLSSGHFNPTQTYDCYKAVEGLDPACTEFFAKGKDFFEHYNPRSSRCHYCFIGKKASNLRRYLWSKKDGPFGKEFPVSEAPALDVDGRPIYSSSEVPNARIHTEGIVKRIIGIAYSPPDLDAEGSEEVEVIPNSAGHPYNDSPSQPPAKRFQSQIIPSTPRNFQPTLATITFSIPHASPHSSHTRPALNPEVRQSPIQQSINSPIVTSKQLQPVASTRRRREKLSPLLFPATQVFQCRDQWPIQVTREDSNTASENQMLWPGYLGGLIEIVGR